MKTLILFIIVLVTIEANGQTDSARLKVTRVHHDQEKTHYWLKDMDTKENIYTVCPCLPKHKKGDIVLVAKSDMIFEDKTPSWRKVNN